MCVSAGLAESDHLIVKRLPVALQDVPTRDHDVDLIGACRNAFADFLNAQMKWGQPGREPC